MIKRFFIFSILIIFLFSSLTVIATEGDTPASPGETTGNETGGETGGDTGSETGGETGNETSTQTLTVQNASFSLEKNTTLIESLPTIEGESNLNYVIVTAPDNGTLTHSDETSRNFSYTPNEDFIGTDSFSFKITKGELESNTATITLSITNTTAVEIEALNIDNVSYTLEENSILTANLPTIEGETDLQYVIVSQPNHGTLTHNDETKASFSYTPALDYVGTDSFTFKLTKGELESNIATVSLTIEKASEPVIPFNYIDMQNHWANYSASHLAARGLIIGEEVGSRFYFYPDREMTRSEFMLFLLAITESNEDAELEIPKVTFADSDTTPDWLIEAAKLAYAKGIIKGSAEGNSIYLNPYSKLTRTEAVVMVNNVLKPTNSTETLKYSDVSSIPEWGIQAVKNLTAFKIIQGSEAGFEPNSIITRGEAAEICFKLIKQLEKDALTPETDLK